MIQKHRISTNIGKDQLVTVEINQDFDLLEILSLKFSQTDVYTNLCADYGVVCGRVIVNNGFGIPNAKISIFVPLSDIDEDDPVISALYPYKSVSERNDNGYKYNLLPARKQHGGHEPTGTFPDQLDILSRTEVLEVYEKYYKYTVKTNESGDFMIWGAPLGQQTIHVDVDLSDIGCFSLRPDDFIRLGSGVDEFQNTYKFKASSDLGTLPQVVSFDKTIDVYPFWGNVDLCQIGITRTDFDLSDQGVRIEPTAYIIGGSFSDTGKNTVNKNCRPRTNMGRKCQMTSEKGLIETIRFTHLKDTNHRPVLELMDLHEDIDDTGSFMMNIKMNMDFLYTNEFGENVYGNDPNKGIPTSAVHRFRFTIKNENLGRVRTTASYLVPNIKEYSGDEDKSYAWSTNYTDYPAAAQGDILNNVDTFWYPQDYFYRFTYNKVYTVSSFQDGYSDVSRIRNGLIIIGAKDRFIGIKDISPSEETDCDGTASTFPVNYAVKNYSFKLLIADILLLLEWFLDTVKLVFLNTIVRAVISTGCDIDSRPLRSLAQRIKKWGFNIEESSQKKLPLVIYPECDDCSGGDFGVLPPENIGDGVGKLPPLCTAGTFLLENPNRVFNGYLEIPYASFTFTKDQTAGCLNCTGPESMYQDIITLQQSNPYYFSGYTAVAQFIDNQALYGFVDKGNGSSSGIFKDYLFYKGTTNPITSHPIHWKSYTYKIRGQFGVGETSLNIIHDGVMHTINFTAYSTSSLSTALHNAFDVYTAHGGGATVTVDTSFGNSGNFTIAPNNTKSFGILTIGGVVAIPSIFTNNNIIIDYTGITYYDYEGGFTDSLPGYPSTPTGFTCDLLLAFSDASQTGQTSCLQEYPPLPLTGRIETGCDLYDVPYDESLISKYYITSGSSDMCVDDRTYVLPTSYTPGMDVDSTIISELGRLGFCHSSKKTTPDLYYYDTNGGRVYPLPCEWAGETHKKMTKSGLCEFKNGVYYIIPGSLSNSRLIGIMREYRKRKRVGKLFCGGIVNYIFTNNWLSGSLYFFAFKAKNKRRNNSKHCYSVVRWVKSQSKHYYRSCVYKSISGEWGEDAVQSGNKKINRPTTFVDLGPRDEFIKEICTDAGLDPNCSISRLIGPTSFKSFGELQGININYRLDVTNNNFSIGDFFKNTASPFDNTFNGDVLQLISTNCEAGIEEFDLQNPKYLGYSYQWLDPEIYTDVFGNGGWYPTVSNRFPLGKPNGPLPITFDFAENGERIRSCLNEPTHLDYNGNTVQGRLTESSQPVPFFLWDKKSRGFGGTVNTDPFNQNWDYSTVIIQPLQGMTYGYSISGSPNDASDKYLLLPITYTFTGNTINTKLNYTNELPFDVVNFTDNGIGGNSAPDDYYLYDTQYPGFTYLYVSSGYTANNGGFDEIEAQSGTLYTRYGPAGTWNSQPWNYLNDIIIRRTEDYYSGSKQILSTPFLFYFGLRPGSTGLDKFIERFGPTGAFPSAE